MKLVIVALFALVSPSYCLGTTWSEDDRKNEANQITIWEENLTKSERLEFSAKMELLGLGLRNMGYRAKMEGHDPQAEKVYLGIQKALLTIPGHAEYYGNKINEVEREFREEAEAQKKEGTFVRERSDQPNEQLYAFQTLRELPSPETLRVLGELLLNEQRLIKEVKDDESNLEAFLMQNPPCKGAMEALAKLVEEPPVTGDKSMFLGDLKAWQQWYRQVKEGRRTVRFKGDPKEYSLQGPVREAKDPDVPRETKRPDLSSRTSSTVSRQSASHTVPWISGIVLIFAALLFYLLRRWKRPA